MDILNSGSFVPLDNREKIEHLIFTAKTLATETSRAAGFQNSGLTNQQLALEMWKGAEYMCRAHEEATVRNLFLSNFLQKLNEVVRETAAVAKPALTPPPPPPSQTIPEQKAEIPEGALAEAEKSVVPMQEDEFIGVVPQTDIVEEDAVSISYADECKPECEDEIVEMTNGQVVNLVENPIESEQEINTTVNSEVSVAIEGSEPESDKTELTELSVEIDPEYVAEKPTESQTELQPIRSIALAENEPFNFDSCTITAVVQLLPVNDGYRRCVVSIRSHEFLPQITIHEVVSGQINYEVKQLLESSLAKYRTELPALAADRIKKEAQSNKKRASKSTNTSKEPKAASAASANLPNSSDPASDGQASQQSAEPAKDQQTLFAQ